MTDQVNKILLFHLTKFVGVISRNLLFNNNIKKVIGINVRLIISHTDSYIIKRKSSV